jgi:hypothetical protein
MKEEKIVPVGKNVFTDLSVEELEQRLEIQMLSIPSADWCLINSCSLLCNCYDEDPCPLIS